MVNIMTANLVFPFLKLSDVSKTEGATAAQQFADSHEYVTRHPEKAAPICLNDAGWTDHYGHRRGDVDVEHL